MGGQGSPPLACDLKILLSCRPAGGWPWRPSGRGRRMSSSMAPKVCFVALQGHAQGAEEALGRVEVMIRRCETLISVRPVANGLGLRHEVDDPLLGGRGDPARSGVRRVGVLSLRMIWPAAAGRALAVVSGFGHRIGSHCWVWVGAPRSCGERSYYQRTGGGAGRWFLVEVRNSLRNAHFFARALPGRERAAGPDLVLVP